MADPAPSELAEALRSVVGELVRNTRPVDELAPRFAGVLGHLDRDGPLTPGELADRRRVRQQSMTSTLERLAADGYLTREVHPSDRRKALVRITDQGVAKLEDERRRRSERLAEAITDELTTAERATLSRALPLLERLAAHLSAATSHGGGDQA
jgi:DNA-binding MarR family transcriptional regulator